MVYVHRQIDFTNKNEVREELAVNIASYLAWQSLIAFIMALFLSAAPGMAFIRSRVGASITYGKPLPPAKNQNVNALSGLFPSQQGAKKKGGFFAFS